MGPLAVSIDNPKFCPGCVPSTHKNTAGTCDFGDRRSEEEKKLNPIESMGFTSMTLETQNYCSCTCNVECMEKEHEQRARQREEEDRPCGGAVPPSGGLDRHLVHRRAPCSSKSAPGRR